MEFIKHIDFFSIKFNFYTNNQPNYQNLFGGIMTFFYLLCCIGIFIIFSYDDLNRENPSSTISEISDKKAKMVNLNNEKIWIPFRIVTEEKKFIDHRKILNISPYFVEGKYNNEKGMNLQYHLLNLKLCNETSMINETNNFKIEVPLNELFCIEKDNISFGGNWNDQFINYLQINLFLCKDGCERIAEFLKKLNTSLLFDFYYPIVQFQPTNYKRPIEIIYRNYYYKLNSFSYKITKLYIQEHILSDDKNLLKRSYKNSSCWGLSSINGDDYFLTNEIDPVSGGKTNKIFTMDIYMDNGLVYYTRTYKKIILIISDIFPIFRFVLYFIKKFTQHVKMSVTKQRLAGLIFENLEPKPKKIFPKKVENLEKESNKKINQLLIELNKGKEANNKSNSYNIEQKKNFESNNNDLNNKSNIYLNNDHVIRIINKNDTFLAENKKKSKEIKESLKIKTIPKKQNYIVKKKGQRDIFPLYYFFLDLLFDKLINPQKFFCMQKAYFTMYNFMCQIYDISTHIILFKQFNLLNNMILEKIYEENGICPSKPYTKININDNKVVEKLNKDLKNKKSILFSNNLL